MENKPVKWNFTNKEMEKTFSETENPPLQAWQSLW